MSRRRFGGDFSSASYTLSDMAGDSVGLLAAFGLDSAHIVGASMGGMIAQTVAIEYPARVRSLTSIMSTTGDATVGQATQEALGALLSRPPPAAGRPIERTVSTFRVIGSPGFDFDEAGVRARAGSLMTAPTIRSASARQLAGDPRFRRTSRGSAFGDVPALVLHGGEDPLVDLSGGRATADAVPEAELVIFEGMGHDLPRELWPEITAEDRRSGSACAGGRSAAVIPECSRQPPELTN